jgi:hypothetical protein
MKKGIDIDKDRMEFLPHFGADSRNGWIRMDVEGLKIEGSSYLFINLDDIEELTKIPLNEITDGIKMKWNQERPQAIDNMKDIEDVEYIDVGRVRLPKKKSGKD